MLIGLTVGTEATTCKWSTLHTTVHKCDGTLVSQFTARLQTCLATSIPTLGPV